MQTNWEKVISDCQLISLPEVYLKLQQLLADDDYSLNDIAEVISFDPAITARLLRMVNSSFFGLNAKVETINHAINYVGVKQVHDLVLATSMADTFRDMNTAAFNMRDFWTESIYCAIFAQNLGVFTEDKGSDRLFIAGLLHNIGNLMMRQSIPDLIIETEELAEQQQIPIHEAEKQIIGFNFAEIGAELLHQWNLPENLTMAIKYQLIPSEAEGHEMDAAVLNIAGYMTSLFSRNLPIDNALVHFNEQAIKITKIHDDQLTELDLAAKESLGSVIHLLFPNL